jgi:lipoyl(octanoyl) transferase
MNNVEIRNLGSMDYCSAWALQTREMEVLRDKRRRDVAITFGNDFCHLDKQSSEGVAVTSGNDLRHLDRQSSEGVAVMPGNDLRHLDRQSSEDVAVASGNDLRHLDRQSPEGVAVASGNDFCHLDKRSSEDVAVASGNDNTPHKLLFVQHPHVYTLGKSGHISNMLAADAEVVRVDRGGDITYHGPGQWVVYPIFRLDTLGICIKEYMYRLEEVIIQTLAEYGIKGERLEKYTGVWLDAVASPRKICAMGVRCSEHVTMHGLALNVNTDLSYFSRINPCGFTDKGVTSMQKELGTMFDIEKVKKSIIKNIYYLFV